jgi:hypothetical protein
MITLKKFNKLTFEKKINALFEQGTFVMSIRYYKYKINLYLFDGNYLEVFVNHKHTIIERISLLDTSHSRMKFYSDQIKFPIDLEFKSI